MRKLIPMVLTLLLCFSLAAPALAGVPLHSVHTACVVQDTLYFLRDDIIWSQAEFAGSPRAELFLDLKDETAIPFYKHHTTLMSDGETLYLLYPYTGTIFEVTEAGLVEKLKLDIAGLGEQRGDIYYTILEDPVMVDGYVYFLVVDPVTYVDAQLYRFSMTDGQREKMDTANMSLKQLRPYKDGTILLLNSNDQTVYAFDAASGKLGDAVTVLPDVNDGMVTYDAERDKLYYLNDRYLMVCGVPDTYLDHGPDDGGWLSSYAAMWHGELLVLTDGQLYVACASYDPVPVGSLRQ